MGLLLKLSLCFTAVLLFKAEFTHAKKTTALCYMAAWASTREHQGKFTVRDSNLQQCTHIVYAFMGINESTSEIESVDRMIDLDMGGKGRGQLKELKELKTFNPNIKVLASVGGYSQGSIKFSEMASSSSKKSAFINSLVKFIRDWELDGIDICWQYPGQRGGRSHDRRNFVQLLKEIKSVFKPQGWLLTVHVLAKKYIIDISYHVKAISEIVDYINLAAVEYHGPWDRTTGIMAPLRSSNENNVAYMVNYTIQRGANPSKILLGLPTYGHAYIVQDDVQKGQYLGLVSDSAFSSQWTNEAGIIAYNEICYEKKTVQGWQEEWDLDSVTPVTYYENRFVSYDNKKSLIEKAKLVNVHKLGGIMLWSMDMDDFLGLCSDEKYPLLKGVVDYLDHVEDVSPPPEQPCNGDNGKPAKKVITEYGK